MADEDGSRGRTDYRYPKEIALLQSEQGLMPVVNSVWADTQPEAQEIQTALTVSPKPFWRKCPSTTEFKNKGQPA